MNASLAIRLCLLTRCLPLFNSVDDDARDSSVIWSIFGFDSKFDVELRWVSVDRRLFRELRVILSVLPVSSVAILLSAMPSVPLPPERAPLRSFGEYAI